MVKKLAALVCFMLATVACSYQCRYPEKVFVTVPYRVTHLKTDVQETAETAGLGCVPIYLRTVRHACQIKPVYCDKKATVTIKCNNYLTQAVETATIRTDSELFFKRECKSKKWTKLLKHTIASIAAREKFPVMYSYEKCSGVAIRMGLVDETLISEAHQCYRVDFFEVCGKRGKHYSTTVCLNVR